MADIKASTLSLRKGLSFGSGNFYKLNLNRTNVYVLEIEDIFFKLDSAVMMPDSAEDDTQTDKENRITGIAVLKTVFLRLLEHPEQKMMIAGHTDTSGRESYNFELSELRAESVTCLLENNKDRWVEISKGKHRAEDIQQILTWIAADRGWDCDPQGIDGVIGSKTKKATLNFQTKYNDEFKADIKKDGIVGTETWGAFFDIYQDKLSEMLDADDADMASYRLELKWQFIDHKYVGCGENWPIEEAEKDNYRSQRNRRIEILFFDPDEVFSLDCHSTEECEKDLCPLYPPVSGSRIYLPVHPYAKPQSSPVLFTIEQPNATNYVRMHSLYAYLVYFEKNNTNIRSLICYKIVDGKLCTVSGSQPVLIDCHCEGWFYFSHRDDLLNLSHSTYFKKDRSGLPLIGPIDIPCGSDAKIEFNIWNQNDWIVIHGVRVDGERPAKVLMAEWREDYTIGRHATLTNGQPGFVDYGDSREKETQEMWKGINSPIELIHLGNPGTNPMWAGTLSGLPSQKAKIILVADVNGIQPLNVGSFNEVAPTGSNIELQGHHIYNGNLADKLLSIASSGQSNSNVDNLPSPPSRCLVPGDMCWQDQGQTNNCGPYSFSTAMNYWFPYTNNPAEKNGALYARAGNVDDTVGGARTPRDIVNAAEKFKMFGRDNDAEKIDKSRALKLLKLWLLAGIPVLILVKEEYTISSYHWKTVVGYDGDRFFMNNSGADNEIVISQRTPGVNYEKAPVGNDVDSESAFYKKWKAAGGDIVDVFTSVDECTFIPIYPKDPMFRGTAAR